MSDSDFQNPDGKENQAERGPDGGHLSESEV